MRVLVFLSINFKMCAYLFSLLLVAVYFVETLSGTKCTIVLYDSFELVCWHLGCPLYSVYHEVRVLSYNSKIMKCFQIPNDSYLQPFPQIPDRPFSGPGTIPVWWSDTVLLKSATFLDFFISHHEHHYLSMIINFEYSQRWRHFSKQSYRYGIL